jgi:hypothetical protein
VKPHRGALYRETGHSYGVRISNGMFYSTNRMLLWSYSTLDSLNELIEDLV